MLKSRFFSFLIEDFFTQFFCFFVVKYGKYKKLMKEETNLEKEIKNE